MAAPVRRHAGRIEPLFLLLAATGTGIVASLALRVSPATLYLCALPLALLALGWRPARRVETLLPALVLVAAARAIAAASPAPRDISRLCGRTVAVTGRVVSVRDAGRNEGARYVVAVETASGAGNVWPREGSVWVVQRQGPPPAEGARVRLRGSLETPLPATNPGGFDLRAYLARQGIHCLLRLRSAAEVATLSPPGCFSRLVAWLRATMDRAAQRRLTPEAAALAEGLLLSARGDLSVLLEEAFRATGTVHILSVSGLHMTVLAWAVGALAGVLGAPFVPRRLATVAVLWLFSIVTGGGAPVVRSAGMASLVLLAPLLRREIEPLHALAVAAIGLLIASPLALFDPGAQLSFVTVATLLLWMPAVEARLLPFEPGRPWAARAGRCVALGLSVGLLAQLGSGPLVAYHFSLISWIAPAANLPIAALSEGGLLAGLVATLTDPVPGVGEAVWWLVQQILTLLAWLARVFAAVPCAATSVAPPPAMALAAYYAILLGGGGYVRSWAVASRLFVPPDVSRGDEPGLPPSAGAPSGHVP